MTILEGGQGYEQETRWPILELVNNREQRLSQPSAQLCDMTGKAHVRANSPPSKNTAMTAARPAWASTYRI
ncbi:hypothetical protein ACRAKI_12785 [Saccharothrix isguenensis]